jgi:hypothetical protein
LRFISGTAIAAAAVTLASCGPAPQTEPVGGVSGLTVEIKISPRRFWLKPWQSYGDDYEFNYSFNAPMPDFSSLVVGCELLIAGDQNPSLTMFESIRRNDFKPSADGRFVATRGPTYIPRGGHTGANCQIRNIVK